jgi:hypothetical protein
MLSESQSSRRPRDLQTKEIVQSTQILNSKITTQRRHKTISSSIRGTDKDDIINIDQQIHRDLRTLKKE